MADRIVTIGSGKDYSTIALAVAGEDDFQAGEDNIVFTIDAGTYGICTPSGFTTTSSHRLIFTYATGAYHGMARSSGVIVSNANGYTQMDSGLNYVSFVGLAFITTANDIMAGLRIMSNYCVIDRCIAYDCYGSGTNGRGFFANWQSQYPLFKNCVSVNNNGDGIALEDDGNGRAYYCDSLNNGGVGISTSDYRIHYLKNCYSGANDGDDYSTFNDTAYTTCRSEDGTESTSTVSIANCAFTSSTAGSEDVEIGSASQLNVGTDLSADSYPVTIDAYGNTRAASPYIGASEYVASATGNTYYYQQQQL